MVPPPTTTAAPTRTAAPTTTRPPTTTTPAGNTYTYSPTGGTVAVRCSGNVVSLVYATPSTGWRIQTESTGPSVLQVQFLKSESQTQVHVVCQNGVAQAEIETG
jgi:hypothetical protein